MEVISPKPRNTILAASPSDQKKRIKPLCIAFTTILVLLLVLVVISIVLFFTVFKPKHPITTINSINLKGFKASLDLPRLRLNLNLTLIVNLTIKNRNKATFKYGNDSMSMIYYRNEVVGQGILPAGKLSSKQSTKINSEVKILADRIIGNPNVFSDVVSGKLPLTTYTKISGKVNVLNVFKHHLVSYSWCDIAIDVSNRSLEMKECRYKTKL
ncbi:hypothetical protein ACHQM5_013405 [Ranunculus cassubicifolius]